MPQEVISFQCGEFAGGHGPGSINRGCPDCGPEEPTLPTVVDPDGIDGERPTLPSPPTTPETRPGDKLPGCVCRVVGDGTPTGGDGQGGSSGGGGPTTGGGGGIPEPPGGDVGQTCLTFEQKCFPEQGAPDHSGGFEQAAADAANSGGGVSGKAGGACTGIAPACCEDTRNPDDEPCCPPIHVCIPRDRPTVPDGGIDPSGTPPTRPRTFPTTPGPTDGWRCVDTQGHMGCIYSTFFGPNEVRYPSRQACEAVCFRGTRRPPTTPGLTDGWRCVNTQGVMGCMYTTNPAGIQYPSKQACERVCYMDQDGGRRPPTTPGPTDGWRCVDSQGVMGCIYSTFFGPNEVRYPSRQACERVCYRDVGRPKPVSPNSYWKCVENESGGPITGGGGPAPAANQLRECILLPESAFGPNDRKYNSQAECKKSCETGGPIVPESGAYVCEESGPTTAGGMEPTAGTTRDCVYTNLPAGPGQKRYRSVEECQKECRDDGDPTRPRGGPGTEESLYKWYCEDVHTGPITTGGVGGAEVTPTRHCVRKLAHGDDGHDTPEKCRRLCRNDGPTRPSRPPRTTPTGPGTRPATKVPGPTTGGGDGGYKCRRAPYWYCFHSPDGDPNEPEIWATPRECEEACKPPPTTPTPGVRRPTTQGPGAYKCRMDPYWNCYFVSNLEADGVTSWAELGVCQTNCGPRGDKGRPDTDPGGGNFSERWRCVQGGPVTGGRTPLGGVNRRCESYLGDPNQGYPSRELCEQDCFGPDDPGIGTVPTSPTPPSPPMPTKPKTVPTTGGEDPDPDPTRPRTVPTTPGPGKPTLPGPDTPGKVTVSRWVCEAIGTVAYLGVQRRCIRRWYVDGFNLPGHEKKSECEAQCDSDLDPGPISPRPPTLPPTPPTPPGTRPLPTGPVTPDSVVRWKCEEVGSVPYLGVRRECVRKSYADTGGPYPGQPSRKACEKICSNDWDPGGRPRTTPGGGPFTVPTDPTTPTFPTSPRPTGPTWELGGYVCPFPGTQCVWSVLAEPTDPTVWRSKAACDGQCIVATGPTTPGGGGGGTHSFGGYVCMRNSQNIALGCAYDQNIPSVMADGANYEDCMKICLPDAVFTPGSRTAPTAPTFPTSPTPPTTGGGTLTGYTDWWTCGLPINEECQKVTLPTEQPPPPGSYDKAADCHLECVREPEPPGPTTGDPSAPSVDPWWACAYAAGLWSCFPAPPNTLGAYPTANQCRAICVPDIQGPQPDTPPPGGGGGGGSANTPNEGFCNCRIRGGPTIEVSFPDDVVILGEVISESGFPKTIEVEKCWQQRCIYTGPSSDPDNDVNSDSWNDEMGSLEDGPDGWTNPYGEDNYTGEGQTSVEAPGGACAAQSAAKVGCCTGIHCCDERCIKWRYTLDADPPTTGGEVPPSPPTTDPPPLYSYRCEPTLSEDGGLGEVGGGQTTYEWQCVQTPGNSGEYKGNTQAAALAACEAGCKVGDVAPAPPRPGGPGGPGPGGGPEDTECKCKVKGDSTLVATGSYIDDNGNHCLVTTKSWKQECKFIHRKYLPPGTSEEDKEDLEDDGWTQYEPCPGQGTCWTNENFDSDYTDDVEECEQDPNCSVVDTDSEGGCGYDWADITTCCKDTFWRPCCPDASATTIRCTGSTGFGGFSHPNQPGGGGDDGGPNSGGPGGPGAPDHIPMKWKCVTCEEPIAGQTNTVEVPCCKEFPIYDFREWEVRHDSEDECKEACGVGEEHEELFDAWYCGIPQLSTETEPRCHEIPGGLPEWEFQADRNMHKSEAQCKRDPLCSGREDRGDRPEATLEDTGKLHSGTIVYGPTNLPTIAGEGIRNRPGVDPQLNLKDHFISRKGTHKRRTLDLNDASLAQYGTKKRPTASTDRNTAITLISPDVSRTSKVQSGNTKIFRRRIFEPLYDLLKVNNTYKDWDSNLGKAVTANILEKSLNLQFLQRLGRLRSVGGTPIPLSSMLKMVMARILDGTIGKFDMLAFRNLVRENSKIKAVTIVPSNDKILNETVALGLIENAMIPLDPAKNEAGRDRNMMELWKTLPTDLDKGLPIKINKPQTIMNPIYCKNKVQTVEETKGDYCFPIDDGDIVKVAGRNFEIQDGDYINVRIKGAERKLKLCSERGHAFIIPRGAKEQALHLLGGNTYRTLHTESTSAVEFTHSLNLSGEDPRNNAYILKLVPSAIESTHTSFKHVIESSAVYSLLGTSSTDSLREINDWVKHKINHKVFYMSYDDVMLDHIIATQQLVMKQHDIIVEGAKKAKNIPLLTRQIPYYIIIFPTNRQKFMLSNTKSSITSFTDDGVVSRELTYSPSLNPKPGKAMSHDFITYDIAPTKTNILGKYDSQAREVKINYTTNKLFKEGYEASGKIGPKITKQPARKGTSLRLAYNIISELVTNYKLYEVRKNVPEITTFDLFSRMTQTEFNKFVFLENSKYLMPRMRDGLLMNVRIASPTRNDGISFTKKTKIKSRIEGAPADIYFPIKATLTGQYVIPPTTSDPWSSTMGGFTKTEQVPKPNANEAKKERTK